MRLIDADALREIWLASDDFDNDTINAVLYSIDEAPTMDAEPVRHGRWIKDGDFLICLNCESEIDIKNSLGTENHKNYCPNCGAKMDEGVQ